MATVLTPAEIKQKITDWITTNGQGDITGAHLNTILAAIMDYVGVGYALRGTAPASAPSPDVPSAYLAAPGTYTNYESGDTVIPEGSIAILKYDGSAWSKSVIKVCDTVSVSQNTETGKKELLIGETPELIVDNAPEVGSDNLITSDAVATLSENIGISIAFESGGINYLTGQDIDDAKSIRTGKIIFNGSVNLNIISGKAAVNAYIIKYTANGSYVGYESFSITNTYVSKAVAKDSTFDYIRLRISHTSDWTSSQIEQSNCIYCLQGKIFDLVKQNTDQLKRVVNVPSIFVTPHYNVTTDIMNDSILGLYLPYYEGGYKVTTLKRNDSGSWNVKIYTSDLRHVFNFIWTISPEGNNGLTFAALSNELGVAFLLIDWNEVENGYSVAGMTGDAYLVSSICYELTSFPVLTAFIDDYKLFDSDYILYDKLVAFESGSINYTDGTEMSDSKTVRCGYFNIEHSCRLKIFSDKWFGSGRLIKYSNDSNIPVSSQSISFEQGREIEIIKDASFSRIRLRLTATTDWTDGEISSTNAKVIVENSITEDVEKNKEVVKENLLIDPHFLIPEFNELFPIKIAGFRNTLFFDDGVASIKNAATSAKSMIIELQINPNWFVENGFAVGDKVTIGVKTKAYVNEGASVTAYDFYRRDASTNTEYDPLSSVVKKFIPDKTAYADWQQILTSATINSIDLSKSTAFICLARIQVTDASATQLSPDILYIKEPFISKGDQIYEFSESQCSVVTDYVNTRKVNTENVHLVNAEKEIKGFQQIETELINSRWCQLQDNHALPTSGVYIGRIGDDVYVSVNGVLTKLNS